MKKTLFSIIAFLTFTMVAKADALVVADVGLQPGKTATVQVALSSTGETYRAVLFTLMLPTGISIVTDEYGEPVTSADTHLTAAGYNVTANHLDDGSNRFAVMNTSGNTVIPAECGPLFSFTIEADASLVPGAVLTGTMSDIKLTDAYAVDHHTDNVTFSITIEETRTILDETSEEAPEEAENVDVRVKRTINANEWSTICLPFAMTEAQVKGAFGEDVQLGDFTGYEAAYDTDDNVTGLTVNFNDVTAIEANHPYIIKVSSPLTEFTVDGVDIAPEDEPCVAFGYESGRPKVYHPMDFIGTYVADFDFYNDALSRALFLNGNKFWYATENTKHMKAFRAYFDFDDVLASVENAASRIILTISGETDDIQDADIHKVSPYSNDVYDLQGRKVNVNANVNVNGRSAAGRLLPAGRKNVKKGLYIRNGKKEIVK